MIQPEIPRSRVYIDDYEVDARLHREGIERAWLVDAAQQGNLSRRMTSPLELPGAPAYKAASKGLEVLRQRSIGAGWFPDLYLGIPVAYSNTRTVAIAVTEGDEFTGILGDQDPTTKALKGPNTSRAAEVNRLFEDPPVSFWYLLTFADGEALRAELSSPMVAADGRVRGWNERVLIGEIPPLDGARLVAPPPTPVPAPEIEVRRKSA